MSDGGAGGPRLSVCIPTHHGRRDDLAAALERLVAQAAAHAPGAVELCVTDNASDDGTAAMVDDLVARGAPIRYQRHARDRGAARNVLASVAMARGEWCWLHASDDLIADGALAHVLRAVAAHPEAVGLTVGRATFELDMSREREVQPAALLPADPERGRTFADPLEALAQLGLLHTFLPSQVVRRAVWDAVVAGDPERPLRASAFYPHVYVLARVLLESGRPWTWIPDKLVLQRPRYDVAGLGGDALVAALVQPTDLVRTWNAALSGVVPAPRRPLRGPYGALHRALLARAAAVWAVPAQLDALKARPGHGLRDDARMLLALVGAFWSLPAFWRTVLPTLLRPHAAPRRRRSPMAAMAPAQLALVVAASLPTEARVGRNVVVACELVNRSDHTIRSAPPHPVHLGARWRDDTGRPVRETDRVVLPAPIAPGASCALELTTPTPWAPGRYVLDVGAVQEGVAWAIDVDPSRGVRGTVDVRAPDR